MPVSMHIFVTFDLIAIFHLRSNSYLLYVAAQDNLLVTSPEFIE